MTGNQNHRLDEPRAVHAKHGTEALEPAFEPELEPALEPAVESALEPEVESALESAFEPAIEPAIEPAFGDDPGDELEPAFESAFGDELGGFVFVPPRVRALPDDAPRRHSLDVAHSSTSAAVTAPLPQVP